MKKIISMLLCIVLAVSLFSGFALADEASDYWPPPENGWYDYFGPIVYYRDGKQCFGWVFDDGNWYYMYDGPTMGNMPADYGPRETGARLDNSFLLKNGRVYYFGEDGKMVTGTKTINGKKLRFDDSGYLQQGWVLLPRYDEEITESGATATIVSKTYYYVFDSRVQTGWCNVDGEWYYMDPETSIMVSDKHLEINGKWYRFEKSGAMYTGWEKQEDGTWKYYKPNGAMAVSEAVWVKNKGYLFDENGIMLTGEQERNGNSYLLSDSGAMYTGWKKTDDGQWIYYKADGAMAKDEWVMVKNKWYLFDENGIMRTGLLERYDHTYYFNDNGSMATGWKKLDGVWYYFRPAENDNGPQGSMVKDSWVLSGNKWYYIGEDGTMVTGTKEIYSDNSRTYYVYYFNDSGAMQTGWHYVDSAWRFFRIASSDNGPQGSMAKSVWVPAGDKWYYTDNYGAMVLGWKDIGTKTYYFSSEAANYGQMVTGKQVIDGKEYTFGDNGALVK